MLLFLKVYLLGQVDIYNLRMLHANFLLCPENIDT